MENYKQIINRCLENGELGIALHYFDKLEECTNIRHQKLLNTLKKNCENREKDFDGKKYIYVTINPYPNILIEDLINVVKRIIKKAWIDGYTYVYEQRGEVEGDYHGLHCHMIIKKKYSKQESAIYREIQNTCKHICDYHNKCCLNIQYVKNEIEKDKIILYMDGIKDVDKQPKCENDIRMRFAYNLENKYVSNM